MEHLFLSIITAIGSLFGIHSQPIQQTINIPVNFVQNPASQSTMISTGTQPLNNQSTGTNSIQADPIPLLFQNYVIIFNGGTSTDTDLTAIKNRLDNTYIKSKTTGVEISLSPDSSVYEGWPPLIGEDNAEVMGHTLYVPIYHLSEDGQTILNTDLWQFSEGDILPKLVSKNVGWFAVSEYGNVALTDGSQQTLTILDTRGNVLKTINFDQIGFCYTTNASDAIADAAAWSGPNVWIKCDDGLGSIPTYLEINANTFQLSYSSTTPLVFEAN